MSNGWLECSGQRAVADAGGTACSDQGQPTEGTTSGADILRDSERPPYGGRSGGINTAAVCGEASNGQYY
jgi:hypothetical protein